MMDTVDAFVAVVVICLLIILAVIQLGFNIYDSGYKAGYRQGQINYMNGVISYEKVQKEEYKEIKIK